MMGSYTRTLAKDLASDYRAPIIPGCQIVKVNVADFAKFSPYDNSKSVKLALDLAAAGIGMVGVQQCLDSRGGYLIYAGKVPRICDLIADIFRQNEVTYGEIFLSHDRY